MFRALLGKRMTTETGIKSGNKRHEALSKGSPFNGSDPAHLRILVRSGGLGRSSNGDEIINLVKAIQNDHGDDKATVVSKLLHREIDATTLTLHGYYLVAMPPRMHFSRLRNQVADKWEQLAHERADAFVYHLRVGQTEEYLAADKSGYGQEGWERDRFQVSHLLQRPTLMENPSKPLLLLVNSEEDDDFDLERLTNLFGLTDCSPNFARPFRAVMYSTSEHDSSGMAGTLKEAFEWLARSAHSPQNEERTALTGSETEEDSSVVTWSTAGTSIISSPDRGHFVMDYEPTLLGGNPTLQRFDPIKMSTHCPFARGAKLWGGKVPDELQPRLHGRVDTLKEAASLNAGPLAEFIARSNNGENLDGFCMEIKDATWGSVECLGEKVRLLLTHLADLDPSPGENAMKMMGPIDHPHWRFRFAEEDFFLTTFSPAYEKDSSRYTFGVRRGFILFQPMTSFGRHGLTEDTPASATNWDNPTSMRDKARVAFKKNGCPYHIPEELPYPVAEHVVKPKKDHGTTCVRWWEPLKETKK